MRLSTLISSFIALGLVLGGCAQTPMIPAQQLDEGTTVVSGTLDEPGQSVLPSLSLQVTHGVGGGDLTANVSGLPYGGGLTGRYYLSDWVNAEIQLQSARTSESFTHLGLIGIQNAPTIYDSSHRLGAQLGFINRPSLEGRGSSGRRTVPFIGLEGGYGPIKLGASWQMQVELEGRLTPTAPAPQPVPTVEISVGLYRFFR